MVEETNCSYIFLLSNWRSQRT